MEQVPDNHEKRRQNCEDQKMKKKTAARKKVSKAKSPKLNSSEKDQRTKTWKEIDTAVDKIVSAVAQCQHDLIPMREMIMSIYGIGYGHGASQARSFFTGRASPSSPLPSDLLEQMLNIYVARMNLAHREGRSHYSQTPPSMKN